ncbi:MAG: hypothetical protein H6Q54_1905 [Deltaproteobacteria bacterium]|nr:hypothetical protein [Deltaproteobacteria bacterium]
MEEYSVIGKRVPRFDSREKVMGHGKYATGDTTSCKNIEY